MENIRYMAIGKREKELTTGSYIRKAFGDAIQIIRHKIQMGTNIGSIYHFGEKLGNTTVIIIGYETSPEIFVDITGEEDGCRKTKSKLEKKFDIRLAEL
ncbi:MAG: hypothetical protein ABIH65_00335 [Nanoarchaeota archaeon]